LGPVLDAVIEAGTARYARPRSCSGSWSYNCIILGPDTTIEYIVYHAWDTKYAVDVSDRLI